MRRVLLALLLAVPFSVLADSKYEKPPKEVMDVLHAAPLPNAYFDPTRQQAILATPVTYPPLADLAQPWLKLAGRRIVTKNRSQYDPNYSSAFDLVRVSDGSVRHIALPKGMKAEAPDWTVDGKTFAFSAIADDSVELWIGDAATAKVKKVDGLRLNPFFGWSFQWMPDQKTLIVQSVPKGQGPAPVPPAVPPGPNIKETTGGGSKSSTYELRDVLTSDFDEKAFEYYASVQIALVDAASGKVTNIGKPAMYSSVNVSPDGHLLVEALHRPFSRIVAYWRFPSEMDVWDRTGKVIKHIASNPLEENVPTWGVQKGPRAQQWRATAPAELYFLEALDEGDWDVKVPNRDRLMRWSFPFDGEPKEVLRTEQRFEQIMWSAEKGMAFFATADYIEHRERTYLMDFDTPGATPKKIWDLSSDEAYEHPGSPIFKPLADGNYVIDQEGDTVWLRGQGASPEGDRPFLDKFDLKTLTAERLFRCDKEAYETFSGWTDRKKGEYIVRRETTTEPPNYSTRTIGDKIANAAKGEPQRVSVPGKQFTKITDPTPQIRGVTKRLVTYKRADGIDLSFTLYLPPGYKEGTKLPAILNAYPLDYTDAKMAGQVSGSTKRFTMFGWQDHLYFLLQGYAIIDDPALPVVGDQSKIYDTYMEQLISGAKAAVDAAAATGAVDRDRIGIMGHSHGGLMTVNLLTHSDLFRTGVARSGAYNRSLTAFGFQTERRTLWEATDVYVKVSPYFHVKKLKLPVMLIHGEMDANPGTVPLQSTMLYDAIRGNGGTARLVTLPYESHGYSAIESNEHVLWEEINWFDKYVKNAPKKTAATTP